MNSPDSPITEIKEALVSGALQFTRLGDGTSVLLSIDTQTVLSLNTSATQLVNLIDKEGADSERLKHWLAETAGPGEISAEQIAEDLDSFLQSITTVIQPAT